MFFSNKTISPSFQYLLNHISLSLTHLQPFAIAEREGFIAGNSGNKFAIDDMTPVNAVKIAAGEFLFEPMQYLGYRERVFVGKINLAVIAAGFNTNDVFGQHGLKALVGGNDEMCHINFIRGADLAPFLFTNGNVYSRVHGYTGATIQSQAPHRYLGANYRVIEFASFN